MEPDRNERKELLCKNFDICNDDCPLYHYMNKKGVHACGALCEILLQTEPEQFDKIMDEWDKTHTGV